MTGRGIIFQGWTADTPVSTVYSAKDAKRISAGALEVGVLELASFVAGDINKTRITPRSLMLAIRLDEELSKLLSAVFAQGGVPIYIHANLRPKKTEKLL